MPTQALVVRAHHLVCLVHYARFGGTHPTLPVLLAALREDPERTLRVVAGPDDICTPCPHWNGEACTRKEGMEPKNRAKDLKFLAALALQDGAERPARDILGMLVARLTPEILRAICPDCNPDQCTEALSGLCGPPYLILEAHKRKEEKS